MGLKFSYTLLAPIYDLIVASPTQSIRKNSLQRLHNLPQQNVLINGIGTGLDIPYLPDQHIYTATDITPAMLEKCNRRLVDVNFQIDLHTADVMNLPFANEQFDTIIMHLILAVVPDPQKALTEAMRVLKPGGKIIILDKFLRSDETAFLRRLINPVMRRVATRTDVVFELLLKSCPQLKLIDNQAVLMRGWFRSIELEKLKQN